MTSWTRAAVVALLGVVLAYLTFAIAAEPRIVGGSTTTITQYPWQAALVLDERFVTNDFEGLFCGGTFIAPRIVQTAAHCVVGTDPDNGTDLDANDVNVVGGRTELNDETEGEELDVQGVHPLNGFDSATFQNDLAWIVLSTEHAETATETEIDIAGTGEETFWDPDSPTQVSGWGATSFGGAGSNTLKAAVVPVILDTDMADPLVYGADFFPASMLGAGVLAGGTDSCQGDSGGPLVGPSTDFPGTPSAVRLVGVVSFGAGCAGVNKPGVYSRIANQAQFNIQAEVDFIASPGQESLGDQGTVYGTAGTLTAAANGPGQSIIRPAAPPPPPAPAPPAAAAATCNGKRATIVGADGSDRLSGTPAADVIAALGGNDKVSGLAGNDRICGGAGKDTLNAGKGNDKLFGQAGKDTLKGGPGNDELKGGAGKDKQVQ